VRQILKDAGIDPAAERTSTTWSGFLRSQANALLARDFFETFTLTGVSLYVRAVIEHANQGSGRHRAPITSWITQAAKNLVMELEDTGSSARFLIRDRDRNIPPCSTPPPPEHRQHPTTTRTAPTGHLPSRSHPSPRPPTATIGRAAFSTSTTTPPVPARTTFRQAQGRLGYFTSTLCSDAHGMPKRRYSTHSCRGSLTKAVKRCVLLEGELR
jgi:hypothetical protein